MKIPPRSTIGIAAFQTAIEYEYRFTEYRFAEYESSNKRLPITFFPDFRGAGLPGRRMAYRFFSTGSHVILYRLPYGRFGAGGGTETSRSRLHGLEITREQRPRTD
jgi:hypothetical protein